MDGLLSILVRYLKLVHTYLELPRNEDKLLACFFITGSDFCYREKIISPDNVQIKSLEDT